jgi:hypothetical protein
MKISEKEHEMSPNDLLEVENNMDILQLLDDWSWTENTLKIKKLIEKEVIL